MVVNWKFALDPRVTHSIMMDMSVMHRIVLVLRPCFQPKFLLLVRQCPWKIMSFYVLHFTLSVKTFCEASWRLYAGQFGSTRICRALLVASNVTIRFYSWYKLYLRGISTGNFWRCCNSSCTSHMPQLETWTNSNWITSSTIYRRRHQWWNTPWFGCPMILWSRPCAANPTLPAPRWHK